MTPRLTGLGLALLWGIGCTGKDSPPPDPSDTDDTPPDTDDSGDTATGPTTRGAVDLPPLVEAEDLDPAEDVVHVRLTAAAKQHTLVDLDGTTHTIAGYAYNDVFPGPLIRAKLGDTVIIELDNQLDQPTTIHWHGLDVPFAMDGVTWMGAPVQPGEGFTYTFTVAQAGTFWYHPHFNTEVQVSGGLLGVFIVEDPADPAVDHDVPVVLMDWPLDGEDMAAEAHDHLAVEGTWTVNGVIQPTLRLPAGETARLRVLNASSLGYAALSWPEMRLLGGDQGMGGGLTAPEQVVLAPGDRAEWELLLSEDFVVQDVPYVHQGGAAYGDPVDLMPVVVEGTATAPAGLAWPFSGAAPTPDPGTTDVTYVFSGSRETDVWLINGEVFPEVTIAETDLGETIIIEVRNLSPAEHPYHLHGLRFEVLSVNGEPPPYRRIEDTINVSVYGTVRLRVVADNPGDWMSHCHILPHAEGGMMTVLRVRAPE